MATEYINTPDGPRIKNTSAFPNLEWLMGGNPSAIERQEAEGQRQLINSSQLPRKLNSHKGKTIEEVYAEMRIRIIGPSKGDDLFFDVELPEGWKLEATDHSMWSKLIDSKGGERASIFYKAAFYDRDAFINIQ